jgi:type IV secretory pathway VirB2 component (pilin)
VTFTPDAEASALLRAAHWIEAVMLGPIATTVAVLAIASLGFAMLSGRLSVRHGLTAVLGCFVTFGAASIAYGIAGLAQGQGAAVAAVDPVPTMPAPQLNLDPPPAPAQAGGDPYAGASVRN